MESNTQDSPTPVNDGAPPVAASELTAPLSQAMPPVSLPVVEQTPASILLDKSGTVFDPVIHRTEADGSPRVSKGGWFIRKDHGAPSKAGNPAAPRPSLPPRKPAPSFAGAPSQAPRQTNDDFDPVGQIPAAHPVADQYDLLADIYLRNGYGPMILAFGGEILPDEEEHAALKNSLAAWLRIRRAKEFSPGLAFGMTAAAIFMKKMEKPSVREKAAHLWLSCKQLYSRYFGKKE